MISREYLKTLASYQNDKGLILTASLTTSRLDDWRQTAPTFLNSEFGRLVRERKLEKDDRRTLDEDFQKILDVLHYEVEQQTQGLVVIADGS